MKTARLCLLVAAAAFTASGCGAADDASAEETTGSTSDSTKTGDSAFPVTIEHVYGETTIESEPTRVTTVSYGNADSVLALGVVPVAMTRSDYADPDGDGMAPWTADAITELGGEEPTLLDETDGIDFEAVADSAPELILAPYSGLTEEDYATLSKIAPTVAYNGTAWGTSWQDQLTITGQALGLEEEAEDLVAEGEARLDELVSAQEGVAGKKFLLSYYDATDLSNVNFYTTGDSRVGYMEELGLEPAQAVEAADPDEFWIQTSSEQIEQFDDVDMIVMYGTDDALATMQDNALLDRIPAVNSGAVAVIDETTTVAAAITPTALSINSEEAATLIETIGAAAAKAG